jgi:hypothetical protein
LGIREECEVPTGGRIITEAEFIKDSINYERCCKKYNSCWTLMKNKLTGSIDTVRIIHSKQLDPKNTLLSWACLTADSVRHRDFCANNPNPIRVELQNFVALLCKDAEKNKIVAGCNYLGLGK